MLSSTTALSSLRKPSRCSETQAALGQEALGSCCLLTEGPAAVLNATSKSITTCHKVNKSTVVWTIKTALKTVWANGAHETRAGLLEKSLAQNKGLGLASASYQAFVSPNHSDPTCLLKSKTVA